MTRIGPTNVELAEMLEQMAELLLVRGEPNPDRVQAYLHAAETVRAEREPLAARYAEGGREALMGLPGVGAALATHLAQYLDQGRAGLRDRLLAAADPAALLQTLPGISPRLARALVDDHGVTTLAELERAAHDGRLASLPGVGPRTVEAIRLQVNSVLSRAARRRARRVRRQVARMAYRPTTPAPAPAAMPTAVSAVPVAVPVAAPADADRPSPLRLVVGGAVAPVLPLFPPAAA